MNDDQLARVREVVLALAEKSGTSFDAAFETALSLIKYHGVDVVPWGKTGSSGSGGVEKR